MPKLRAGTKRRVHLFLGVLCVIAFGGAAFGSVVGRTPLIGALNGMINSVIVLGGIVGAEMFLPQTRLGHALERAPFLVTFAVKWLVYQALIVVVIGSGLVRWLVLTVLLGGDAAQAAGDLGAKAFATGNKVGFADAPDLHTAAHEAAHVVQQRSGVSLKATRSTPRLKSPCGPSGEESTTIARIHKTIGLASLRLVNPV